MIEIAVFAPLAVCPLANFTLKAIDVRRRPIHLRRWVFAAISLGLCGWYFCFWALFQQPPWYRWFGGEVGYSWIWYLVWLVTVAVTWLQVERGRERLRWTGDLLVLVLAIDFAARFTPWAIYRGP